MKTLGDRIREIRKEKKLTQASVAKASGVSRASVTQWELDSNHPRGESLISLAKSLGCNPDWLLYGDIKPIITTSSRAKDEVKEPSIDYNVESTPEKLHGGFPLISWVQAGDWDDICLTDVHDADHYPCPVKCSKSTFILKVIGKSMSPVFNEGELIFVDPEVQPDDGKYVVARLDDENQATFKQLIIEDGHKFLQAANPNWPTPIQPMSGNCTIVGVVISAMRFF